jgi:calcineurin-like phosphoesterase
VIGVDKDIIIKRFVDGLPAKFETAKGDPRFAAVVVAIDEDSGRASSVDRMFLTESDVLSL